MSYSKAAFWFAIVLTAGIAFGSAVGCTSCSDQAESSSGAGSAGNGSAAGASGASAGTGAGGANASASRGGGAGSAGASAGSAGASASSAGSAGASAGSAGAGAGAGGGGGGGSAPLNHDAPAVIVVLGSSTAAGTGPKDPKNAWVERYRAYLTTNFPKFELTNLAVGGYSTYHVQPTDYVPPAGPAKPDIARNISKALSLKPDAIIINMPTNDTEYGYSLAVQMANFDRVTTLAAQNGVPCWVTTSQPRDFGGQGRDIIQAKHLVLFAVRDAIKQKYADRSLDFWTGFADADGNIEETWSAGDGTHMNDDAHAQLVKVVIDAKIPDAILGKRP